MQDKWVIETVYLGQTISFKNRISKELSRRTAIAWGKLLSLKIVLKNKAVSIRNKVRIIKSLIIPSLTYSCQTWSITKKEKQKLRRKGTFLVYQGSKRLGTRGTLEHVVRFIS